MTRKKVAVVFGTRPEAIKMAPVIRELNKQDQLFEPIVIVTAQHREMLDQVLDVFQIEPDFDMNIMKNNQSLSDITSDVLRGLEQIFIDVQPDIVLVHGDTTTSVSAALAAFYQKIPIAHVEAGLRTYDKYLPFPEEANRQLIDTLADLYFVPTEKTKENLLMENKNPKAIYVTGNTAIDAIRYTTSSLESHHPLLKQMDNENKWIVVTMHRRENQGQPMRDVFLAIKESIQKHKDIEVVFPVHLSPVVQKAVKEVLSNEERIHLVEPLEVSTFHKVLAKSYMVLTDSGGLQEEAPSLNIPVFVLRDKTERPEGEEAGTLKLIGTNKETVFGAIDHILSDEKMYDKMAFADNPYGDGKSSKRMIKILDDYLNKK